MYLTSACCHCVLSIYNCNLWFILKKAVSLPEVYNKTAEINGFTVAASVWRYTIVSDYAWQEEYGGLTSNHWSVYSAVRQQYVRPFILIVQLLDLVKELYSRIAARNQLNCKGSNSHTYIWHTMKAWCLRPPTSFLTLPTAISEIQAESVRIRPSLCLVVSKEWLNSDSHTYQQE